MATSPIGVRFGSLPPLKGVAGELESIATPIGHKMNWRRFLEAADDDLLQALKSALRFDGSPRDLHLVAACCESYDGMGRIIGKGGRLKWTAQRYVHHAIATVDFCTFHGNRKWSHKTASLLPIQDSFYFLSPPNGKQYKGALTSYEARLARAACLAFFAKGDRQDNLDPEAARLIASNYDVLMDYASVIIEEKDTSPHFLLALVETQPSPALISGML